MKKGHIAKEQRRRFIGGHYASLKQSVAMQKSAADENFNSTEEDIYNTIKVRLMLDMVYSKTIVFPNLQYLDGYFFHLMVRNEFNDGFMRALVKDSRCLNGKATLIEVRVQPGIENLTELMLQRMQDQKFIFSAPAGRCLDK